MRNPFRKDIEPRCAHFRYDPLRRVPPRPASLDPKAHSPEDFSL